MIAIHHRPGSFSEKWIEYCERNNVPYKLVNCYDNDIINQLNDCKGLMWHWHQDVKHRDYLFARQLIFSLEAKGLKVFPNSNTCWHFDDKLGQKYLFEAMGLPLVPTYVFYDKGEALEWAEKTNYPKVFKTRNGAGARNVRLIKTKQKARKLIEKCFNQGISSYDKLSETKESLWRFRRDKDPKSFARLIKYLLKLPLPARFQTEHVKEKNYVYFQDFVPDNKFDYRVVVIGNRAFAIKRLVRQNDFRSSGSGLIRYSKKNFPANLIAAAFDINKKLKNQSLALDLICDKNNTYVVIETSYAFTSRGYLSCPGYWDDRLNYYETAFHPEYFMIEDFLNELK